MPYDYTFTVFTPTYNRRHTLGRVFDSLTQQTLTNFEWLIIDDGSTDGTGELVEQYQEKADFPIRYVWQENAGKHMAVNRAAELAQGELFLLLDSDDACHPNALERFHWHWAQIPAEKKGPFTAVTALCEDQHGNRVGDSLPADYLDSDSLELAYKYKIGGEKWGFHRTEVLRQFPFPKLADGLRFIPESTVWGAIAAAGYKTRYINEVLRVYYIDDNTDQLSAPPAMDQQFSFVMAHWKKCKLQNEMGYFAMAPGQLIKTAVHLTRFSLHAGNSLRQTGSELPWQSRLLFYACIPAGAAVYLRDRQISREPTT